MSSYPALVAARAKWDRGVNDLETLEQRVREVNSRHPYGVDVEFDGKTGWHTPLMRGLESYRRLTSVSWWVPPHTKFLSSNLIVWDLAERKLGRHAINKGRVANDISFPIAW